MVNRVRHETVEVFELVIDRDAQRLKRARGWVDPPLFTCDCARYQFGQVPSRLNRLVAVSLFNYPASDAPRAALFAVFKNDPRNFYF